ncbi:MAG: glycerophosphodiester phosphodiesterase [Spirochaetales bacterium]|nr:glycerophosphodiester phosphodiesterase [Spirochaetales bacterium]
MNKPLITAHTGCNDTPHNTLESILSGAEWGADINEVDVRVTRDMVPVLWHDDFLKTKNGGEIRIEAVTYGEIAALEARKEILFPDDQVSIARLEDVFDAAREKRIYLNLDLKDDLCLEKVASMVKEWALEEMVVFSGCEKSRAIKLKKEHPEFQVLLNADDELMEREDLSYMEKARILCSTAISASCCGLSVPYQFCRPELVEYADLRMLPVVIWTLPPDDRFEAFIDMGVYSITTLHVKELVELKRRRFSV